ncbi:MAG: hypothetical protein II806_01315, partial [Bacteroidaceae bacterium]|nr:hypothetical protein [Bacteroidaceae bacterium]
MRGLRTGHSHRVDPVAFRQSFHMIPVPRQRCTVIDLCIGACGDDHSPVDRHREGAVDVSDVIAGSDVFARSISDHCVGRNVGRAADHGLRTGHVQ